MRRSERQAAARPSRAGAALELESASGITGGRRGVEPGWRRRFERRRTFRNVSGTNTWQGLITLAAAAEIQSDAGTLTLDPATGDHGNRNVRVDRWMAQGAVVGERSDRDGHRNGHRKRGAAR
jgi:hypothetical protein